MTPEEFALHQYGNKAAAARALGIPRTTFRERLEAVGRNECQVTFSEPCQEWAQPTPKVARKPSKSSVKHLVIPDCQVKPGVPLNHLIAAGNFIAEKRPDVIICLGDFADMPSLSSYDRGKRSAENKRYKADVEACHKAMELLMSPIVKAEGYAPRLVMTLGNHEDRIARYADDFPALHETISVQDLGYQSWGWEVYPYREVVKVDGIAYSHFFYNPNTGKPYAGENLETRLKTIGMSFTMGHQQGLKSAIRDLADGTRQRGLVAGSFYQHDEEYKGPQGNGHWHGLVMKHEVSEGNYDLMEISLDFLLKRYL